jgi:FemAB-related protein (PEP-CTERM system-associated)
MLTTFASLGEGKLFGFRVRVAHDADRHLWDEYIDGHPDASLFHRFGWRDVIHGTYKHDAYFLMAVRSGPAGAEASAPHPQTTMGVLPLIHLRSAIFGSSLVSLPFVDGGGILADSSEVEEALLSEALSLARRVGADSIDLRCEHALAASDEASTDGGIKRFAPAALAKRSQKVRMVLTLPGSSTELVRSFRSKLRSQFKRPLREGCTTKVGGMELLEDFYRVFLVNMRDLGSPVHSKELMRRVLETFRERSRVFAVYLAGKPIAASLVIGFKGILRNPWASSDRRYSAISPNMLLYLRMLEFACDEGYRTFDFGRSTPGEGTYRFKEQWGAVPAPLHWYLLSFLGDPGGTQESAAERFKLASRCWRKLPVAVTRVLGPRIRKHISL